MAVIQLAEPTAEQQQFLNYNQNAGGNLIKHASFTVPANTAWCMVGCYVAGSATPASVPATITAIEALAEVTSVNGDQLWLQVPSSILPANHEAVLHASSSVTYAVPGGVGSFDVAKRAHEIVKPSTDQKVCIFMLRVPAALDATSISALQTAIEGIAGINLARVLIHDYVPSDAVSAANLNVSVHLRIDPEVV